MTPPAVTHPSASVRAPLPLAAAAGTRSIAPSSAHTGSRVRKRGGLASRQPMYRLALVVGMLAIAGAVAVTTNAPPVASADASFVRMMRVMAMIKALLVVAAAAVLWWRLARPVTAFFAAGYLLGAWFMVAATVLIWQLSSIGAAAVLFHTGELSLLLLAWRDTRGR